MLLAMQENGRERTINYVKWLYKLQVIENKKSTSIWATEID